MKILSPAKINLCLHIIGKRTDGYHEIETLMCCIGLYDEVGIQFDTDNTSITCSDPLVPQNETNIAHRAATMFLNRMEFSEGVDITIKKRIPLAAGLGGGSSNAASVLLGLNDHFGQPFSMDRLMPMGLSLGADVPFFLFQKPAIATGIGEKLEAYPGLHPYHLLLINPGFNVSTAEIYRKLNLRLTKCKKKFTNTSLIKHGFDVALHLCNDLETVTASMFPEIVSVKEQLVHYGALGALMSGSGPTVFGIFSDLKKAKIARNALLHNDDWKLYVVDMIVNSGIRIENT